MESIDQLTESEQHFIDPIPEEQPPVDHTDERKAAKKAFSRIGLVISLVFLGVTVLTGVASFLLAAFKIVDKEAINSYTFQIVVGVLPICLIGYPLMYLFLRKLPAYSPEKGEYKARHEIMFIIMCLSSMFIGNIISTISSSIISGGQSTNQVAEILSAQQLLPTLYFVIIAPIGEELIFRKVIIDRVGGYGQKWAILYSALLFSLFHLNVYQLLYTFAFGLIFGYVYTKSGKIINTIIIHIVINIFGSVLAPLALNLLDQEKIARITELSSAGKEIPQELLAEVLPGMLVYYSYMAFYIGLVIAGIVLFFINVKKFRTVPSEILPDRKTGLSVSLVNVGTILYIVLCLIFMVYSFIASMVSVGK